MRRNATIFDYIEFAQQLSGLNLSNCIRKMILGIFNFSILICHKTSTFSFMVDLMWYLNIPKIRCYFNINTLFIKLFLLKILSIYTRFSDGKVE